MTEERFDDVVKECSGTSGINIGGNTVTKSTDYLPDEQRKLIRWAFQYARDRNMRWDELASDSGISTTVWYRVWHDRYVNASTGERIDLSSLCDKIAKWKAKAERGSRLDEVMFVETSVWDRIDWICTRALVRRKMGFIYGESHTGKTICLQRFQQQNNHGQTTYVEMPPSAGVQLMTKTIARALHVSTGTCYEKLIEDVIEALDPSKLLLVDEIHRVWTTYQKSSVMRCLDVLRYIHDQTKCGMVLCGTNAFRDELQEGTFRQYLKQLKRRGLYEIQLPDMPPRDDLDKIARAYGLRPATGDAEKVMLHLVADNGIAVFFTRLDDAQEMAAKKNEAISWEHFVRAVTIVEKMSQYPEPQKKRRG